MSFVLSQHNDTVSPASSFIVALCSFYIMVTYWMSATTFFYLLFRHSFFVITYYSIFLSAQLFFSQQNCAISLALSFIVVSCRFYITFTYRMSATTCFDRQLHRSFFVLTYHSIFYQRNGSSSTSPLLSFVFFSSLSLTLLLQRCHLPDKLDQSF